MTEKILFVDDDRNILDGYRRALRKDFQIDTAFSGVEALTAIQNHGSYAVIVSDMRMPGMDGVEFLWRTKNASPDSVRIMLTGNADQQTAIDAVNEGSIFRFLNKPCPPEQMAKALRAGIEQYRLVRAEKDLIEKTLSASVQTLTDILSLINATAFGRATRVRHLVRQLTRLMKIENAWQTELAAMLCQIGCVTIPEEILQKVYHGSELDPDEFQLLQSHPQVGSDLIAQIPRLETVAEIIAYQEKRFNGGGLPYDGKSGEDIPVGARILKVALDFEKLIETKMGYEEACEAIENRIGWYDPKVVEALKKTLEGEDLGQMREIGVLDLKLGMILAEDVHTIEGMPLFTNGNEVTASLFLRMKSFLNNAIIKDTVKVLIPPGVEGAMRGHSASVH